MLAIIQRFVRLDSPVAIVVHDPRADRIAVLVDDRHSVARTLAAACKRRAIVISHPAVVDRACNIANVIGHFADHRLLRHVRIHDHHHRIRRQPDVAGRIARHRGEFLRTVRQRVLGTERPSAVRIDRRFANLFAIGKHFQARARLTTTRQRRPVVVGRLARLDLARRLNVVLDRLDGRLVRRHRVDDEIETVRRIALVAILVDLHRDNVVRAVVERRRGLQFPRAVCLHDRFADLLVAVPQLDAVTRRLTLAAEHRTTIVGHAAAGDRTRDAADVVDYAVDRRCLGTSATITATAVPPPIVATRRTIILAERACRGCHTQHAQRRQAEQPQAAQAAKRRARRRHQAAHVEACERLRSQHLRRRCAVGKHRNRVIIVRVGRDVLMVGTVLAEADQRPFIAIEVLDDQLRLIEIGTFQAQVQVLADTAHRDVLRTMASLAVCQDELAAFHGLYPGRRALLRRAQVQRLIDRVAVHHGKLHSTHFRKCP
ncbi:hypothetical protein BLA18110_07963 [Burkholderia lata]|nr:hypothetical protein BLA18110_07963 [Burkholderia lata]